VLDICDSMGIKKDGKMRNEFAAIIERDGEWFIS